MKHPMQAIILDKRGVARFQSNAIIEHLVETHAIDLNKLATMTFSKEDHMQLAQLMGYSVSGFGDLSYADPLVVRVADEIVEKIIKPTEKTMAEPNSPREAVAQHHGLKENHLLHWIFKAIDACRALGTTRDTLLSETTWKNLGAPDWVLPAVKERYGAFDSKSDPD